MDFTTMFCLSVTVPLVVVIVSAIVSIVVSDSIICSDVEHQEGDSYGY